MSVSTPTAGWPVHAVATYRRRVNPHKVALTDWTAVCGATGTRAGRLGVFGQAGTARRLELCPQCFPGRDVHVFISPPYEVQE